MSVRTSARIARAAPCGESSFQTRPLFFEPHPVIQSGEVERSVGTELQPDGQDAAQHHLVVLKREPGAVFLQLEAVDARVVGRARKTRHKEVVSPLVIQGRARVVDHPGRARVIGRDWRDDVRGLPANRGLNMFSSIQTL